MAEGWTSGKGQKVCLDKCDRHSGSSRDLSGHTQSRLADVEAYDAEPQFGKRDRFTADSRTEYEYVSRHDVMAGEYLLLPLFEGPFL